MAEKEPLVKRFALRVPEETGTLFEEVAFLMGIAPSHLVRDVMIASMPQLRGIRDTLQQLKSGDTHTALEAWRSVLAATASQAQAADAEAADLQGKYSDGE